MLLTRSPLGVQELPQVHPVRLACLRHAASVRSEPGSNSPKKTLNERVTTLVFFWFKSLTCDRFLGCQENISADLTRARLGASYSIFKERRTPRYSATKHTKKDIRWNLMPKNLLNDMLPHGHYPAVTTSSAATPSEPNCCLSTLSWEVKEHNPPVFLYRIYHVSIHLSRTFFSV